MKKYLIILTVLIAIFVLIKKMKPKENKTIVTSGAPLGAETQKKDLVFKDSLDYIKKMLPIAKAIEVKYKIPYLFLMAQTALETGYGKSSLVREAANFGGIKAIEGQPYVTKYTHEHVKTVDLNKPEYSKRDKTKDKKINDVYTDIYLPLKFAVFNDLQEGLNEYIKVLLLPRYKNAFKYSDVLNFATEIKKGGYATSVNYVNSIVDVAKSIEKKIKDNNL